MIKTTNYNEQDILNDIIELHVKDSFDIDVTYSKGRFYKNDKVPQPKIKSDLIPRFDDVIGMDASDLFLLKDKDVKSLMFDPPFVAGHTKKPTGIIGEKYHGFPYVKDLWEWYSKCLVEFSRVIDDNGWLVIKCQDTVSSGKQFMSHAYIMNEAEKNGFYCKDLFVLLAKNRLIGHNTIKTSITLESFIATLLFFKKKWIRGLVIIWSVISD